MASRSILHSALEMWIACQMRSGLAKLRKRKDFDAVHFVGTGWDFSGFAVKGLAHHIRTPFTVWPAVHPYSWGDDVIDVRLYRQADTVFCQTSVEADHLVQKGVERGRISICGLPPSVATNGDGTALRERLGIGARPTVLFMGRRDEGKGYPALLRAWSLVLASVPDAVLILAGRGGEEYEQIVQQLPIKSVRDLGVVDDSTKADALAACDVFCLPSAHESFGIVYVEAWSYGKPVICGTAPACRELVEDGVTGLHATQDPGDLAAKLVVLLSDAQSAQRMGNSGAEIQRRRFTAEGMLRAHLSAWGSTSPTACGRIG
jgi:glycosyltransferase involved in cell wall biosynthesis